MVLLAKVDFILKEQGYKKDMLVAYGIGRIKIIFALSTEVVAVNMQVSIV